MKIFGYRLRELREEKGWEQRELKDIIGVSQSTLSEYENGKKVPRPDKLKKITEIFDVSVDYMLGKTDEKKPINNNKKQELDLEKIMKMNPHIGGVPISEEDAQMFIDILESYKKRWLRDRDMGKIETDLSA
ncbi:helix-turn-helix domain-containing protein [Hazenella sp. IB182357]|uniref:Helix-turn-helix domain-containing protein n=1 Tax=Polycladospora coralii TaxID=2771432 RepID=A0A926N866_9BACL|nr:helix-turn-helix transcriptional regulator [Polycladospora coralii]MBD1373781.1 helix-turn-helix domain-containing protein [Polycladospora coralii]